MKFTETNETRKCQNAEALLDNKETMLENEETSHHCMNPDSSQNLKTTEESCIEHENIRELENQIQNLRAEMNDLLLHNEQLKGENSKKTEEGCDKDSKIDEQNRIIDELKAKNESKTKEIQKLVAERDDSKKLLRDEKRKNEQFKSPISAQV